MQLSFHRIGVHTTQQVSSTKSKSISRQAVSSADLFWEVLNDCNRMSVNYWLPCRGIIGNGSPPVKRQSANRFVTADGYEGELFSKESKKNEEWCSTIPTQAQAGL